METRSERSARDTHSPEAIDRSQRRVTRAYDRIAGIYDVYTSPMEWTGLSKRRARLLSRARGDVLEVGAGTGRNFAYYPSGVRITATDVARQMVERARRRAVVAPVPVDVREADVQRLPFADDSFDTVVGTCVFCSVADPVCGLAELGRVVKPSGSILLLEHVRPSGRIAGRLADLLSAASRRVLGVSFNRRTEENVASAGLEVLDIQRQGIWREMVASAG